MTTPTVLARFNDDPNAPFCFEHNGMCIHNPLVSECYRFDVTPAEYGFTVENTGGGCTAWRRDFVLADGRPCFMRICADLSHEFDPGDEDISIGVYLNDTDDAAETWVCYMLRDLIENEETGTPTLRHVYDSGNNPTF